MHPARRRPALRPQVISPPADSSHSVVAGIPLELEHIETGMYRGQPRVSSSPMSSIFGGEVVAQALCAAGNTVAADRAVHSLHAYFLRRGDPRAAVLYRAEDIRDGTSFTTRRVVAQQHGEAILSMAASFYRAETGLSHQVPVGDAPPPQATPPPQQSPAAAEGGYWSWLERLSARFPFELRFVDPPPRVTVLDAHPRRAAVGTADPRLRHRLCLRPAAAVHRRSSPRPGDSSARSSHRQPSRTTYALTTSCSTNSTPTGRAVAARCAAERCSIPPGLWWQPWPKRGCCGGGGREIPPPYFPSHSYLRYS
jgi:Thioesterase-like superfamily